MGRTLTSALCASVLVLGASACNDDEPVEAKQTSAESQQSTTSVTDPPGPEAFPAGDEPVAIEAGTYLVEGAAAGDGTSLAAYTVTVPDGWTADSGGDLKKNEDTPQGISVSPWAIEDVRLFEDACHGELGEPGPAPASAAALVSALRAQNSGPLVSDPVATTVGGLPATQIDLDHPDREAQASCRIGTGVLQVWDGYFVFFPNHTANLYVVDVAGTPQVFVVVAADGASAADRAEAQSIIDSISFELAS